MKTSAECFSNQIKKLEALIKKFVSTKNHWQRLERVLRSKHSGAEVCKKYVGFTISSAPVPRCGNRFSDRSRKSEGVKVKSVSKIDITEIRKEIVVATKAGTT